MAALTSPPPLAVALLPPIHARKSTYSMATATAPSEPRSTWGWRLRVLGPVKGGMAAGADLNHSGLPSIVTVRHSFGNDNAQPAVAVILNVPDAVGLKFGSPGLPPSLV